MTYNPNYNLLTNLSRMILLSTWCLYWAPLFSWTLRALGQRTGLSSSSSPTSWVRPRFSCSFHTWFRVYLDPTKPTFLGYLLMISLYMSLNRQVEIGFRFAKNIRSRIWILAFWWLWLSDSAGDADLGFRVQDSAGYYSETLEPRIRSSIYKKTLVLMV